LGIAYQWAGRNEDARIAFARAVELAPQSALSARNLGLALAALGKTGEAEREYLRAIKLDPTYLDAHYSLASLYFEHGRRAEAEARWRAVLKQHPAEVTALNNVAWVLYERGELGEAARLSDRALADSSISNEERSSYLDTRANIALDAGDAGRALALWDQILTLDNMKPDAVYYAGRAMSLLELGREADAVAAYRMAVAENPKYSEDDYLADVAGYSAKGMARLRRLRSIAAINK
jgi:tetratricopeptide (TPR) repeat protein